VAAAKRASGLPVFFECVPRNSNVLLLLVCVLLAVLYHSLPSLFLSFSFFFFLFLRLLLAIETSESGTRDEEGGAGCVCVCVVGLGSSIFSVSLLLCSFFL
jgi:hypothetical protein